MWHTHGIGNKLLTTKTADMDVNKAYKQQDLKMVDVWLKSTVGLPQYYSLLFVDNGYNKFDFIYKIEHESQLIKIGIRSSYHIEMIMWAITRLRKENSTEGTKELEPQDIGNGMGYLMMK